VCIAAGFAHFSFLQFVPASFVARGPRFFLTAWLIKRYGPEIQREVEKNLLLWGSILVAALVALWVAIHFLFR
jgi:membrane protein DedA with SNARE-associated domain